MSKHGNILTSFCMRCSAGLHQFCETIWCSCRRMGVVIHPLLVAQRRGFGDLFRLSGFGLLVLATMLYYTFPPIETSYLIWGILFGFYSVYLLSAFGKARANLLV